MDSSDVRTPLRLLIADDNEDAATSLSLLLEGAGYDIRVVHDGASALNTAAEFKPAAAILDIGMPQLTGLQVAERIRSAPWGQAMTLIAVTGWGQPGDVRNALAAGFDLHLTKPADPEALERYLAEHLAPGH
jgi:CheY-like chemotaxis protein